MKSKAFTLVELLGVIVILGLLSLIIVPIVKKSITDQKKKLFDSQIKLVEDAARNYMANDTSLVVPNQGLLIHINDLYNKGYISKTKVINPNTDEEFNECVLVKWSTESNQYIYSYDADCSI